MASHEKPVELFNLAVVLEELSKVGKLRAFSDGVIVAHEKLCQEYAWVEALSDLRIDIVCVDWCMYFRRS